MLTTHKNGAEVKLMEIINSIREEPKDYYAVQLNFSDLLAYYKTEYQQKISVNIISDVLRDASGGIFVLYDYDIFVVCKNTELVKLKKLIFQLRYLYMDDPLAYDDAGEDNEDFSKVFNLDKEWMSFFSAARSKLKALEADKPVRIIKTDLQVITPERLDEINATLGKYNIAPTLRQQPVCNVKANTLQVMFTETYVNIAALAKMLDVHVNLTSNRWLFKYFTNFLDVRVIELLEKMPSKYLRKPISLNFNVSTLLSEAFADFAEKLDEKTRKNIVIEIEVLDIFADMQAFQAARNFVQERGFRLCLDGMDALSFRQLDRNALGFDLAKMHWNADLKNDVNSEQNLRLKAAIDDCGAARVILCRCDSKAAIDFGKSLGISLFQGRYVDEQINPDSEVLN